MENKTFLPSEWYPQSGIQLTWPHKDSDWKENFDEVMDCYCQIAKEISKRQKLVIACNSIKEVSSHLSHFNRENIFIKIAPNDDTWARDHGPISIIKDGKPVLLDFQFNGWGKKFYAKNDNQISRLLFLQETFKKDVEIIDFNEFVLEGGAIESNGEGILLTTSRCLLSEHRNPQHTKSEIEKFLMQTFNIHQVLWLDYGFLAGDDTDSHIDTLARFCNSNTIAYVKCNNTQDIHYQELIQMEKQLASFTNLQGKPFDLVALPMADEYIDDNGDRLPATYANFLIMNDCVLLPFYNSPKDVQAQEILSKVFPKKEIIGLNCIPLIKQHGSLHCITMQYPEGFL